MIFGIGRIGKNLIVWIFEGKCVIWRSEGEKENEDRERIEEYLDSLKKIVK